MNRSSETETDFTQVTELAGDEVSREQLERLYHRYYWAGEFCKGKDVLEIACGSGMGLSYLAEKARSLQAGDIDKNLVARARSINADSISIEVMNAEKLPFEEDSVDVILIFEALYYLPDPDKFMTECARVLRSGGRLLIVTANKDLYGFNKSPFTHRYFGVVELQQLMQLHGFDAKISGYWPMQKSSSLQSILQPVKKLVVASGLMPKTMQGKKLLKRLVFGKLVQMPTRIGEGMIEYEAPHQIDTNTGDNTHKVLYCDAQKLGS